MKILAEKEADKSTTNANNIDMQQVLVEVYPQSPQIRSGDHAQDLFLEINKAEPVKLVDMPGVASARDRKTISEAVNKLEGKLPKMFSASQRCRAPNVNVDNLRDNFFAANVLKRHNMKSTNKLLEWLLDQNEAVGKRYKKDKKLRDTINERAWTKANFNKFYLGLESSWLYS